MVQQNWGLLQKSQTDPSTIDEATASAIADHNNDPDSHLDVGQSLQSHKASAIIDHLAESVVNDKLHFITRAYNAIVSDVAGDFSDIQTAIDYVSAEGGGDILISIGTFVLSADLVLRSNVTLIGFGKSLSLINCNGHQIITSASLDESDPRWEDGTDNVGMRYLGIYGGADQMFYAQCSGYFDECRFYNGAGTLVADLGGSNEYNNCQFDQTLTWYNAHVSSDFYGIDAIEGVSPKISNCFFQWNPIQMRLSDSAIVTANYTYHCRRGILMTGPTAVVNGNSLNDCTEYGIYLNANECVISGNFIQGNEYVNTYATHDGILIHYSTNEGADSIITGNRIYKFVYGIHMEASTTKNCAVANNCRGSQTAGVLDSGTSNLLANNITS